MKVEGRQDLVLCLESCSTSKAPLLCSALHRNPVLQWWVDSALGAAELGRRVCCRNLLLLLHELKELLGREWGGANIITTNNKTVFSIIAFVRVRPPSMGEYVQYI